MPPEPEIANEIRSFTLPSEENPFEELSALIRWEDVGKGRLGAVLSRVDEAGGAALVRTTTRYGSPAQRFRAVHEGLVQRIQERAGLTVGFNNALVERYTNAYKTMGAHSDQALDLAEGSAIAVFSCYERPDAEPSRKLIFSRKGGGEERFEVSLGHSSVVLFSVEANRRLKHKIVLDKSVPGENPWLGVTFRTSKTFVRYRDGHAFLPQGARLTPADEEQAHEFYRLRRRENNETDFTYPLLTYTISESDLLPPV